MNNLAIQDRTSLLNLIKDYLDPDGDDQVALFKWETLSQQGTIGFFVERSQTGTAWNRISQGMLPAIILAPLGAEYKTVDPLALPNVDYHYRLIEQEAKGRQNVYGPYSLRLNTIER